MKPTQDGDDLTDRVAQLERQVRDVLAQLIVLRSTVLAVECQQALTALRSTLEA